MALSPFVVLNVFLLAIFACLSPFVTGHPGPIDARQYTTTTTTTISSSTSSSATYSSSGSQFTVPSNYQNGQTLLPNIMDPQAKNPQSVCPGYTASSVTQTQHGITAKLSLAGAACNVYGNDVADLTLTVEFQAEDRLHVEITPTYVGSQNSTWFVLPPQLVPKPTIDPGYTSAALGSDLDFVWSNDPSFSFTVRRYSTGDVLFSTVGSKLVFEDQFIEFVTSMPEKYNVYGLGEVIHPLRLGNNLTRTIWAADVGDPPNYNLYGSHPMYLDTRYFSVDEKTGAQTYVANATDTTASYKSYSHGVFLRNAHGQEILLQPSNITWRTIGGNIDLYFYAGPSQYDVMKTYQTSTVGLPAMQQYFAFGYHQCRWGYANWSQLQDVVNNFAKFSLPLDTIWTDIDYMNQYRDFDNDQKRYGYAEGQTFLNGIHANGQHYVPIVDSAIYVPNPNNASDAYPPFDRGNATNSFMLNPDGSLYIGDVWPGWTAFPDWVGSVLDGAGAFKWWAGELSMWHQNVSFDGIWIDMSEVSSFCVGSCGSGKLDLNPVHPPFGLPGEPGNIVLDYPEGFNITNATEAAAAQSSISSISAAAAATQPTALPAPSSTTYLRTTPTPGGRNINWPPYVINNVQGDLAVHAVSPNATHHDGSVEYDTHNLWGHQILNATYHGLLSIWPSKRPFIIGRSTFAGSGKWAGHWGGDNASKFFYMAASIPQALSFSLFGIPMFGVDTCGFNGNSDEELCNRWMQLSAFFTFYRNHNELSANSQEPYVWSSVIEATKIAAGIRYSVLPYIYTLFWRAHTQGTVVMRAMSWEFPNDPSLAAVDTQFLLGPSLMIVPVLTQGATNVTGYFPGLAMGSEVWYDWYNQTGMVSSSSSGNSSSGDSSSSSSSSNATTSGAASQITLDAPLGHIPLFVRGGSVLPMQAPSLTTQASRKNPWSLLVALASDGSASGELYLDDGESLAPNATLVVEFVAQQGTLSTAIANGGWNETLPLANVTVLGVQAAPAMVQFMGMNLTQSQGGGGNGSGNGNSTGGGSWSYSAGSKVLAVTGLAGTTSGGAWESAWSLSWS